MRPSPYRASIRRASAASPSPRRKTWCRTIRTTRSRRSFGYRRRRRTPFASFAPTAAWSPHPTGLPRSWRSVARRTRSGVPASAAACTTEKVCSSTVIAWSLDPGSNPTAGANSGIRATRTPVSRASSSALRGSRPSRSFESSPMPSAASPPPTRSPETSATPLASSCICARVASSGSSASWETNRRPRTIRSGSSAKLRGETVRRTRRSRSARPPNGSTSSPSARRRAIALIVKSRRARSSVTPASGSTTISKSCRPGPVETSRRGGANSIPAGASALTTRSRG